MPDPLSPSEVNEILGVADIPPGYRWGLCWGCNTTQLVRLVSWQPSSYQPDMMMTSYFCHLCHAD